MAFARISVDPSRMGGLPTIRDTRVTVATVLGRLATGRTTDEILAEYPYLEPEDVPAVLAYAAAAVNEREVPVARTACMKFLIDANLSPRVTDGLVHLRHVADLAPADHTALLAANLPTIADDLERGAIASLSPSRLAVRDLPLR